MSLQLDHYLEERAAGLDVLSAADRAGIGETEALLTEKAIESGHIELPHPRETNPLKGEKPMPKHDQVEEVVAPDFEKMKRIFLHDLKPSEEQSAKIRGDQSAAWKAVEKDAHCNKKGAKWVFWLLGQSEESRDDVLRTFYGALKALNIGISQDLVDKMTGQDAPTMPTVESKGLGAGNLVTLNDRRPDPDAAAFDNDSKAPVSAA